MANDALRTKYAEIVKVYEENIESFELFHKHVKNFFESRSLSQYVHSIRHRLKDLDHLLAKIERKNTEDAALAIKEQKGPITTENLFTRITDLAGVRVLHLHVSQF